MTKKVALVTGGMGGLGTAICRALALSGFTVVANFPTSRTSGMLSCPATLTRSSI